MTEPASTFFMFLLSPFSSFETLPGKMLMQVLNVDHLISY